MGHIQSRDNELGSQSMIGEAGIKARLLMVEDNPADVALFRWALEQAGVEFELSVIVDGGAALDFVRQEDGSKTPDLAILDLNLPKVGGREILSAMRSSAAFATVPVVIWSSSDAPRDRAQLDPLGVSRYIVKPPELNEFLKLGRSIREVLEGSTGKPS